MKRGNTRTYCNPIPLPNYPAGYRAKSRRFYRETADLPVLYDGGKWYLYPSCGMAYVTEDFINWEYHNIRTEAAMEGYAPTIAKVGGKYYLMCNTYDLFEAASPPGPFRNLGKIRMEDGRDGEFADPMIFPDDDGRVYICWGCGTGYVHGMRLNEHNLTEAIGKPFRCSPSIRRMSGSASALTTRTRASRSLRAAG